jgi:uncharacterized protein YndB with AHSA1/START domain
MSDKGAASDRIERSIHIAAPRARVWKAIGTAPEFGRWFGAKLDDQSFVLGERTRGPISIEGFTHINFDVIVERMEPETAMAFRWHPYAVDPAVDYEKEERTLVTFTLKDAPGGGTLLTVVESGFDKVPPGRRLEAFRMNDGGWAAQLKNIAAHATKS